MTDSCTTLQLLYTDLEYELEPENGDERCLNEGVKKKHQHQTYWAQRLYVCTSPGSS